jgi:uncharacterized protein YcsI (UPF0317 family)
MNRRQALTAIAVGASGVLAACAGNPLKGQPEAEAPPAAPKITYKPDIAASDVVASWNCPFTWACGVTVVKLPASGIALPSRPTTAGSSASRCRTPMANSSPV